MRTVLLMAVACNWDFGLNTYFSLYFVLGGVSILWSKDYVEYLVSVNNVVNPFCLSSDEIPRLQLAD